MQRLKAHVAFAIERFLIGGPHYRLLFLIMVVGLVSVVSGTALFWSLPEEESWSTAVWWAFLRLSDPGYLGDDEGIIRRGLSTLLTVAGYVLFLGGLVAVMTQWLNQTIRNLERGLTPLALSNHIAVLGWTTAAPELVAELCAPTLRLRRFLRRIGRNRLRIAILVEEVELFHHSALRQRLGHSFKRHRILLRSGSSTRVNDLLRVDIAHATTVVIPPEDAPTADDEADADTRLLKTVIAISQGQQGSQPPLVVAAVRDHRRLALVRTAYGHQHCELLAADTMLSAVLVRILGQPGLTHLIGEMIDHERGHSLHLYHDPLLDQCSILQAQAAIGSQCAIMGILRSSRDGERQVLLNPPPHSKLDSDDRLICFARYCPDPLSRIVHSDTMAHDPPSWSCQRDHAPQFCRNLLIIGYNHLTPSLIQAISETTVIHLASSIPCSLRQERLADWGLAQRPVHHHEGDFTLPQHLQRLPLSEMDAVVILGSDRLADANEADARAIASHQALQHCLSGRTVPQIVVELRDPSSASFITHTQTEVLPSGLMLTHFLAQIALRRELAAVYQELLSGDQATFAFLPALQLLPQGGDFQSCQQAAREHGMIALGRRSKGSLILDCLPAAKASIAVNDDIIVLR